MVAKHAADLLQSDGFALAAESGVAPDHDQSSNSRKIGCQALGDPVDEMLVLLVSVEIREGAGRRSEDAAAALRLAGGCWAPPSRFPSCA
jgi:hypothetical protein